MESPFGLTWDLALLILIVIVFGLSGMPLLASWLRYERMRLRKTKTERSASDSQDSKPSEDLK